MLTSAWLAICERFRVRVRSPAVRLGVRVRAEADELDERHRSRVTLAHARLEDARVAALATGEVRGNLAEQALESGRRLHGQASLATRVQDLGALGRGG